jgi:hypothetical protein
MKKTILLGFLVLFSALTFAQTKKPAGKPATGTTTTSEIKPLTDDEAIKRCIMKEAATYYKRDFNAWSSAWWQEDYIYWTSVEKDGNFFQKGWTELSGYIGDYIKMNAKPVKMKLTRENWAIKMYEDKAMVIFDLSKVDAVGNSESSKETRFLEKRGTDWKLTYSSSIPVVPYAPKQ